MVLGIQDPFHTAPKELDSLQIYKMVLSKNAREKAAIWLRSLEYELLIREDTVVL